MVGQPLAFDALDRGFGAVNVAAPKTDAVIVTEVKLREITVRVYLACRSAKEFFRGIIYSWVRQLSMLVPSAAGGREPVRRARICV